MMDISNEFIYKHENLLNEINEQVRADYSSTNIILQTKDNFLSDVIDEMTLTMSDNVNEHIESCRIICEDFLTRTDIEKWTKDLDTTIFSNSAPQLVFVNIIDILNKTYNHVLIILSDIELTRNMNPLILDKVFKISHI